MMDARKVWRVFAHQFGGDYCEPQESMLIRINQVTYSGSWGTGTVTLQDASGSCNMYIDSDTGDNGPGQRTKILE